MQTTQIQEIGTSVCSGENALKKKIRKKSESGKRIQTCNMPDQRSKTHDKSFEGYDLQGLSRDKWRGRKKAVRVWGEQREEKRGKEGKRYMCVAYPG